MASVPLRRRLLYSIIIIALVGLVTEAGAYLTYWAIFQERLHPADTIAQREAISSFGVSGVPKPPGPDEIQGGTFSITNAGVYGAINSSPVINVPEVAIMGVHKIVERPVVRDGQIVARPMMNASIGFDHRVVDGELAVKFLRRVCELLEKPELLWFYA